MCIKRGIFYAVTLVFIILQQSCLKKNIEVEKCNTLTYLHTDPISPQWQAIVTGANLYNVDKKLEFLFTDSTASEVTMGTLSKEFLSEYEVDTTKVNGRNVLTISSRSHVSGKYILFFHGGGYGRNVMAGTFDKIYAQIIKRTGATIVLPDYGLAPWYTYVQGYALMESVYNGLIAKVGAENITIMGDSAGGGFSLGFTQKLKIEGQPLPHQVILFSPWLDLMLTNPDIENINDPLLNPYKLRKAGLAWSGNASPGFYQLSPINGPLEGLPPISIFVGGRDIFLPDNLKLRDMMSEKCQKLNFYEYPQMVHVWIDISDSFPESEKAFDQIGDLINNN